MYQVGEWVFIKTYTRSRLSSQTLNLQAHVFSIQKLLHQMFFQVNKYRLYANKIFNGKG